MPSKIKTLFNRLSDWLEPWAIARVGRERAGILSGIILFIVAAVIIGVTFVVLSLMFAMPAHAAYRDGKPVWPFPEPPYVFVGVEYENHDVFCDVVDPKNRNEKIVSNGGFGQKILKGQRWSADLKYTHHSCAFAVDRNSYDAIGFQIIYSPWAR